MVFENITINFNQNLIDEFEAATGDVFERYANRRLLQLRAEHPAASTQDIIAALESWIREEIALAKGEL